MLKQIILQLRHLPFSRFKHLQEMLVNPDPALSLKYGRLGQGATNTLLIFL